MSKREPETMAEWYEYFCEKRDRNYMEYQNGAGNRYYNLYYKYDMITTAFAGYFKWQEEMKRKNNTTI